MGLEMTLPWPNINFGMVSVLTAISNVLCLVSLHMNCRAQPVEGPTEWFCVQEGSTSALCVFWSSCFTLVFVFRWVLSYRSSFSPLHFRYVFSIIYFIGIYLAVCQPNSVSVCLSIYIDWFWHLYHRVTFRLLHLQGWCAYWLCYIPVYLQCITRSPDHPQFLSVKLYRDYGPYWENRLLRNRGLWCE